jgi:hypothetical protein
LQSLLSALSLYCRLILNRQRAPGSAVLWTVVGLLAVISWHTATVHANFGGNWTALFCTGALRGVPPSLAGEHIYQFPNSEGYDGQIYHYVAHEPWLRDAELKSFVDEPRFRYRRILMPALAWACAFGRSEWIDRGYYLAFLLFTGLGVFWGCRISARLGHASTWGLLFLLLPATLVGIDRMIIDLALASLATGFVLYADRPSWRTYAILAAAALTRESGFFLIAGSTGYALWNRRWREGACFAATALPALVWYAWVQLHTAPYHYEAGYVPLSSLVWTLFHPASYPPRIPFVPILRLADEVALAGVLFAFGLTFKRLASSKIDAVWCSAAIFALMGIILQREDFWTHAYNFGRIYTPLLIFLAVDAVRRRSWFGMVPWLAISTRVGMQFGEQIRGIF